ncbi:hypothetical protein Goari_000282, partial [Gossypium aridum]|nr:hypothetical protein [Gossypium aridum]
SSWGGQDSHPPPSSQVAEQERNCESTTNGNVVTNSCSSSSTVVYSSQVSSSNSDHVMNCESTTNVWNLEQTAGDKLEEGEDDIKSSCPLCLGRHMCYTIDGTKGHDPGRVS